MLTNSGLKKAIFIVGLISLLAAGCGKVTLKQDIPSSPKESSEQLPR